MALVAQLPGLLACQDGLARPRAALDHGPRQLAGHGKGADLLFCQLQQSRIGIARVVREHPAGGDRRRQGLDDFSNHVFRQACLRTPVPEDSRECPLHGVQILAVEDDFLRCRRPERLRIRDVQEGNGMVRRNMQAMEPLPKPFVETGLRGDGLLERILDRMGLPVPVPREPLAGADLDTTALGLEHDDSVVLVHENEVRLSIHGPVSLRAEPGNGVNYVPVVGKRLQRVADLSLGGRVVASGA